MGGKGSFRLTAIDEAILVWESASAPWNVQVDVSCPRVDAHRLRGAWNEALRRHELGTRAVVDDERVGLRWSPPDHTADVGPIDVVACADGASLEAARGRVLDGPIDLARAPLVRCVVARRPGHDDLVLSSVSHVLADGVGALRLVKSVAAAYSGAVDPPPRRLEVARRVLSAPAPASLEAFADRWRSRVDLAARVTTPRDRLATRGAVERGSGVCTRAVPGSVLRAVRQRWDASFDDHLVASTHLAVERWNRRLDVPPGRVGVALGVNLRGPEWRHDVVGNLAAFVSTLTEPEHRVDLASALAASWVGATPAERQAQARLVVHASRSAAALPIAVRREALARALPDVFDSVAVSNLGVIDRPPCFEPGHVPEVWMSPPAVPEVGLAVLVLEIAGTLHLSARYRKERFDRQAAEELVDLLVDCLTLR
jgi:hypothetical protein